MRTEEESGPETAAGPSEEEWRDEEERTKHTNSKHVQYSTTEIRILLKNTIIKILSVALTLNLVLSNDVHCYLFPIVEHQQQIFKIKVCYLSNGELPCMLN